jgi:hypothetical protein
VRALPGNRATFRLNAQARKGSISFLKKRNKKLLITLSLTAPKKMGVS